MNVIIWNLEMDKWFLTRSNCIIFTSNWKSNAHPPYASPHHDDTGKTRILTSAIISAMLRSPIPQGINTAWPFLIMTFSQMVDNFESENENKNYH